MDAIFMNSGNSKTSYRQRLLFNLSEKNKFFLKEKKKKIKVINMLLYQI